MEVILAKSAGFCWGVRRAVDKARQVARETAPPVYTDGPLIHNQQMMNRLRQEGIVETSDPQSIGQGTLLIRAHGIEPERRRMLEALPACLVDATCPDVARIQGLIRQHARNGYHIVIFGDRGHAEVVGLLGYAEGKGHVVEHPSDVDKLPDLDPVCLVSQSTQLPLNYQQIAEALSRRFPTAKVLNTICASTRNRQQEVFDLARTVDAIVIVGDVHSANTVRLLQLARTLRPTYHIETGADVRVDELKRYRTIGLTAGASTPQFLIQEVKAAIVAIVSEAA